MSLTFEYKAEFTDKKSVFQLTVPVSVNLRELDVLITPLYVSVGAPNYITIIDLEHPVDLTSHTCKCKSRVLTIEAFSDIQNSIFKASEDVILKRRNQSFFQYQEHTRQMLKQKDEIEMKAKSEAELKQIALKNEERANLRQQKESEINQLKADLSQPVIEDADQDSKNLTQIRSTQTIQLTSTFTKRKMAVPARDGRDIYQDDQIGPIVPDIKKKSPQEQLAQAKSYLKQKKPDYESAIDILQSVLQQTPLFTDALVMFAQILLKQGRADESLQITTQLMKVIQNKHELQLQQQIVQKFSLELQSKVNAMHGASLAAVGKYRDSLKYMDAAFNMNKKNEALKRDLELMTRVVAALD
ncbi:Conserved_hypothetical protein [Hexamita inflata]|uniref:Tetratricopeptide repeat protein n=1 Tax=Hexamita inflata TaxID=28002 RepID=A0AA86RB50_9EUKA|nr:Conserved hypothetical protein [Hexamita inflata]